MAMLFIGCLGFCAVAGALFIRVRLKASFGRREKIIVGGIWTLRFRIFVGLIAGIVSAGFSAVRVYALNRSDVGQQAGLAGVALDIH